jgi:hypothetical protein
MCRASCKKTYKCVTRQQRMGEQSRLSTWPDVNVLRLISLYMYKIRVEPGLLIRSLAISRCCSAMSGRRMFANKEMECVESEEFVAYKSRTNDFRWRD